MPVHQTPSRSFGTLPSELDHDLDAAAITSAPPNDHVAGRDDDQSPTGLDYSMLDDNGPARSSGRHRSHSEPQAFAGRAAFGAPPASDDRDRFIPNNVYGHPQIGGNFIPNMYTGQMMGQVPPARSIKDLVKGTVLPFGPGIMLSYALSAAIASMASELIDALSEDQLTQTAPVRDMMLAGTMTPRFNVGGGFGAVMNIDIPMDVGITKDNILRVIDSLTNHATVALSNSNNLGSLYATACDHQLPRMLAFCIAIQGDDYVEADMVDDLFKRVSAMLGLED